MPHVVNGTGTWYYGKDNRHFHSSSCETCGAHGHLASYDTTLYFTLLFVPLIPLGRRRVVDECPRCRRHRIVKLKDWNSACHGDIRAAVEGLRASPSDAEKARQAIGMAVAYQHPESYDVIRMLVASTLSEHAEVQAALASAAGYFGQLKDAEKAYRKSLAVEDNEGVREALAVNLMRQNRPAEAAPLMEHVFDAETPERWGLASLLVMSYQAEGEHEEALNILDRCEKAWPALARDKEFERARKVSTENRDRARKIPAPLLCPPPKSDDRETRRRGARLARLVGPAVAALLIAWYVGAAYHAGQNRQVHLINGTGVAYDVAIGSTTYQLHPMHRKEVVVPEGELRLEVRRRGVEPVQEAVRIETDFFSRPFVSREFVINPDRTAILVYEEVLYSERPEAGTGENVWSASVGKLLHSFDGIDYPFREFPERITLSGGSTVRKSRLHLLRENAYSAFAAVSMSGREVAFDYLRNSLEYDPSSAEHLQLLEEVLSPAEIVSFTQARLEDRPIRVEWHRLYQSMRDRAEPGYDLAGEYALLLKADPENSELQYLTGRVTHDPRQAERLLARSTRGTEPSAYGNASLAFRRLGSGSYQEALSFARRALMLQPDNPGFKELESHALLALGRYDVLLAAAMAARVKPFDLQNVVRRVDLLVRQGKSPEAREAIDRHCAALKNEGADGEWIDAARKYLTGMYHYHLGREESAGELLGQLGGPGTDWQAALCRKNTADASRIITESEDSDFAGHLLVYISARLEGDIALAEKHLEAGTKGLAEQGYAGRRVAAWLGGDEEPDVEEAEALVLRIDHKRIVLTALGFRFERQRKELFDLAAKLNYDKAFPHLLLKRAHESPGL